MFLLSVQGRQIIEYSYLITVSVADFLRAKVDGLLHQVQAAHAEERHRNDLPLLQAIIPQQLGHGLSSQRNVVRYSLQLGFSCLLTRFRKLVWVTSINNIYIFSKTTFYILSNVILF